jgi:hypothetical protein
MVNCPNCGTSNLDNSAVCVNCGRSLAAGASSYTPPPPPPSEFSARPSPPPYNGPQIPNYLWQSIVVTLCCCLPLGVVSIIFAAQVNSKLAQGDITGAQDSSQKAKMFTLIGLGVGIVGWIIWAIFLSAGIMQAIRDAQAASS